jgi:hypothetical protein
MAVVFTMLQWLHLVSMMLKLNWLRHLLVVVEGLTPANQSQTDEDLRLELDR